MRFLKIASSNVPNYGWPIVVCCYTITLLAIPLASLPCSYSNPSIDEIQFVDLAGNDHHDNVKRSLDTKADHTHPLKIHLHYDIASIGKLDVEKQIYINSTLLPAATEFWEQALYVRQKRFPIRLPRKCITNGYYVKRNDTIPICFKDCQKVNFCGAVEVPKDHLLKCYYCTAKSNNSCDNTSYEDGEGVEGADFILYVSAARTDKCKGVDTIAYAAHCAQEAELDRPIAGHVNICPDALSTHSHDQEILLSTVKHEILHALGFSAGLYAFWRDDSGKPRTKRNRHGKPLSLNREKGYYDWDDSTIKTITRNDWWTAEGITSHTIHVMVTERVKSEVQAHFGCNSLEGAELENQGGDGTAITHWEKRVFENEAMTGTHTQDPVYSRITLALLEDTGWYKANYEAAEDLHWGYQLGCNFTKQSCGQWISEKMANRESVAPFCVDIKHDGKKNLAVTRCTAQRDSLALCNLVPYTKEIPLEYRNFQHLNGLRANALKYYGGSVELSDFCPYNQEFEWKDKFNAEGNKIRRDSRCEFQSNNPIDEHNIFLEVYGNSKCLDFKDHWTMSRCGQKKYILNKKIAGGCYSYKCSNGLLHIGVFNSTKYFPCYKKNQVVHIKQIQEGWLIEGSLLCPACKDICTKTDFIEAANKNAVNSEDPTTLQCKPDLDTFDSYVDLEAEDIEEPCSSHKNHMSFLLLIIILFICLHF